MFAGILLKHFDMKNERNQVSTLLPLVNKDQPVKNIVLTTNIIIVERVQISNV